MSVNTTKIVRLLNEIMEIEMAGVMRYTHYALTVYGPYRIPIVAWMKENAAESLGHAQAAGEMVTRYDGTPSAKAASLGAIDTGDLNTILVASRDHEQVAIDKYYELMKAGEQTGLVAVEEYARDMVIEEESHLDEVNKMLRDQAPAERVSSLSKSA